MGLKEFKGFRMKLVIAAAAAVLALSACNSVPQIANGPRPPQGAGPGGTQFGFWERDAEGAVDTTFRAYISLTYNQGDEAKARATLTKDGFSCKDGNRPEGQPVPNLDCQRLYQQAENVHAWTVKFWPNQKKPEAHYSRTYLRDPTRVYDDRKNR